MHCLSLRFQYHRYSATCYKYWRGPLDEKCCRFDLDEANACAESCIDPETGQMELRCLDGLVNNFNATMLEALRCNMDIKFIGLGASAKAILYYITDYITKTQLKAHITYAALHIAVNKLGERKPDESDDWSRAKRLLQKCAHSLISNQELSAQQIASYLMGYEDHFSSHKYQNLYWTSFERHLETEDPSPECSPSVEENQSTDEHEQESDDTINAMDDGDEELENDLNYGNRSADAKLHNDKDEVGLSAGNSGTVLACSSQISDYIQ
jgi:hypothetical protein